MPSEVVGFGSAFTDGAGDEVKTGVALAEVEAMFEGDALAD